jgi:hypothetical protein
MIQFPERSMRESRPAFSLPVRTKLCLHTPMRVDIFEAAPERVALRCSP